MSKIWQVQEAKAKFSEFLDASLKEGPQIVSRRGIEAAVLVPIDEWRRLSKTSKPTLKDLLLEPGARTEELAPPRGQQRSRSVPEFD